MAPPPTTSVSPVVALVVRSITFVALLISLILLATNTTSTFVSGIEIKNKFSDFYAYRYMLASAVIGLAYTLLQIAFTVYFVTTGNRLGGDALVLFDFYGDKALSYMLATGAAAGFGVTVDMKQLVDVVGGDSADERFLNRGNAAAGLVFVGFLFSAASSIFSSLSLPKRP